MYAENAATKRQIDEIDGKVKVIEKQISSVQTQNAPILNEIKSDKLLISIPMRLWFSPAYRSKTDMWDIHYHEFEDWQLDWLLEKTGWKIIDREKWTNPVKKFGLRPLLRKFTNRYYIVYAERA